MNKDHIVQNQNNEDLLVYLKARRYYFDRAKLIQRIRVGIALLLPILAVLSNIFNWGINNIIATISSFWLIFIFLAQELEKHLAIKGAKAQEYFDTKLFNIPWNTILVGEEPQYEDIIKVSAKVDPKLNHNDWYSGLNANDHFQNVVLAQRMSIVWTSRSMRFYKWVVFSLFIIFIIIPFIYSIKTDQKLQEYILIILLPSLPILIHTMRTFWNLLKLSNKYQSMGIKVNEMFKSSFTHMVNDILILRELQNFIFVKRCESTLLLSTNFILSSKEI